MVQINMRVFKIILLLVAASTASPASLRVEHREAEDDVTLPEAPTSPKPEEDAYDQRQNGTENYRIHVDGLVVVVAPVEALLLAGGIPENLSSVLTQPEKPLELQDAAKPTARPVEADKPPEPKRSQYRGHVKLISLLAPLLRHFGQH